MKNVFFPLLAVLVLLLGACAPLIPAAPTPTEIAPLPLIRKATPAPVLPSPVSPTLSAPLPEQTPPIAPSALPDAAEAALPESYYTHNISGHVQVYPLGCETSAAVDWAAFFGVNFYEFDFQLALPLSDNPDYGFVGDVRSVWGQVPPYAYGVHADPVAALLREYGLPAQSVKGYTLEQVRQKLAEGKPILAWIIGNMEYSEAVEYIDTQGRSVMVAPFEHAVILTGYNQDSIRYMSNGRFYDIPSEVFLSSFGVLGNMAVVYE